MRKEWTTPVVALATFAADAISKSTVLHTLKEGVVYPLIPGVLQLVLTTNTGAAFGIGHQYREVITVLAAVVCAGIIFWIAKRERSADKPSQIERIGIGLVLGGAAGNIWDRLVLGRVTDFLDFAFMSFPVFNLADSLIDVGIALVIIHSLWAKPSAVADKTNHQA